MSKFTTKDRLRQILDERNWKQVDLLNCCQFVAKAYNTHISKSNISSWLSGRYEPNQHKLFILAKALNVNEAWLMGYDVPRERKEKENPNELVTEFEQLFNELTPENQQKAITILKTMFFE